MNQADRDRLVALKKAKDGKMTQRQAAEELKISERQVRRLLVRLRKAGDKAVLHGLRGRSNRRIDEKQQNRAVEILRCGCAAWFRADVGRRVFSQASTVSR